MDPLLPSPPGGGLRAEDLTIDGRKFSESLLRRQGSICAMHPDVNTDITRHGPLPTVSPEKVEARGSLVGQGYAICGFVPGCDGSALAQALKEAFSRRSAALRMSFEEQQTLEVHKLREKHASWDWRWGRPRLYFTAEKRLSFAWFSCAEVTEHREAGSSIHRRSG